ncbi:MAG: hypothetical protein AAF984_09790, partial [Verrucomicrobiota bacterium]
MRTFLHLVSLTFICYISFYSLCLGEQDFVSPVDVKDDIELDVSALELEANELDEIVRLLVDLSVIKSREFLLEEKKPSSPDSKSSFKQGVIKLLSLALKLNPRDKIAIISSVQLLRGKQPDHLESLESINEDVLIKRVLEVYALYKENENEELIKLSSYLLDSVGQVYPKNGDLIYEVEMMKLDKKTPTWPLISNAEKSSVVDSKKNSSPLLNSKPKKELAKRQSSIKGLFVTTTSSGTSVGTTGDIIASYVEAPNVALEGKFRSSQRTISTKHEPSAQEIENAKKQYDDAREHYYQIRGNGGAHSEEIEEARRKYEEARDVYIKVRSGKSPMARKQDSIGEQMRISLDEA